MTNSDKRKIFFISLAMISIMQAAYAVDASWVTTSSSDLNTGTNWSGATVPDGIATFDSTVPSIVPSPSATAPFTVNEINFTNSASAFTFGLNSPLVTTTPTLQFTGAGITGTNTNTQIEVTNTSTLTDAAQILFNTGATSTNTSMGRASLSAVNSNTMNGAFVGQIILGNELIGPTGPVTAGNNASLSANNTGSITSTATYGQMTLVGTTFNAGDALSVSAINTGSFSAGNNQIGQVVIQSNSNTTSFITGNDANFSLTNNGGSISTSAIATDAAQLVINGNGSNLGNVSLTTLDNTNLTLSNENGGVINSQGYNAGQLSLEPFGGVASLTTGTDTTLTLANKIGSSIATTVHDVGQMVIDGDLGQAFVDIGSQSTCTLTNETGSAITSTGTGFTGQMVIDGDGGQAFLNLGNNSTCTLENESSSTITSTAIDVGQIVVGSSFPSSSIPPTFLFLDNDSIVNLTNDGTISKTSIAPGFAAQLVCDGTLGDLGNTQLNTGSDVAIIAANTPSGVITTAGTGPAAQMYFRDTQVNGDPLLKVINQQAIPTIEGIVFDGNSTADDVNIALQNASLVLKTTNPSFTIRSLTGDSTSFVKLSNDLVINTVTGSSTNFSGVISDASGIHTLTINGQGTQELSGSNTYMGNTTVNNAHLILNGAVAQDLFVNGGFLSGTGRVGRDLTIGSGGTISPGNSIGTLFVGGNYIQDANSTYLVEINSLGQTDLIDIAGKAAILGGNVNANITGGFLLNHKYVILEADQGVSGTYNALVTSPLSGFVKPELGYNPNQVFLVIQTEIIKAACSRNTAAVALQLDGTEDPSPGLAAILSTLVNMNAREACKALAQMSGEQYTSLNIAAEISGRQFIRRLYDPLRSIVTTEPCDSCLSCDDICASPIIESWFETGGGQSFIDGNSHVHGFKMSGYEATAGIQGTFNTHWTLGIAGSYVEDHINYDIGNRGKNRMGFGGLYALYRPSEFYVLADLAFGGGQFHVNRSIAVGDLAFSAKGNPNHYQGLAYIEAGFDWNTCKMLIQPFIGLEGGYFRRNRVTETGFSALNLDIHKQTYGNAHSRLGVHMTTEQWSSLKLSVDVAWDCRLTSTKHSLTENFQSFGDAFTITGIPGHRNSIDVAVTGITKLCGNWELYLEAGGEFWSNVSTYNVLGGIKYSW